MKTRKVLSIMALVALVISLPFVFIHLTAAPDGTRITPLQHAAAALANYFGPWGGVLVRLVDFPNAGLRSFSWGWAVSMTVLGLLLVLLPFKIRTRALHIAVLVVWGGFVLVWYGLGLVQIADGLL